MPRDKVLHFVAGLVIAGIIGALSSPILGLTAGIFAGIAKEVVDYLRYGGPDPQDFYATLAGAILGAVVVL
jgi:uncharacterized protein involved in cysteine biosynthesis